MANNSSTTEKVEENTNTTSTGESVESKTEDSPTPVENGHNKRRYRSRDNLDPSPTLGKRQRKVNSIYSGYSMDKKTSHVMGQDTQETTTSKKTEKEVVMSRTEARTRNKKLPKGYSYEPVVETPSSTETKLPSKRGRKKANYDDYVSPTMSKSTSSKISEIEQKKQELEQQLHQLDAQLESASHNLQELEDKEGSKRGRRSTRKVSKRKPDYLGESDDETPKKRTPKVRKGAGAPKGRPPKNKPALGSKAATPKATTPKAATPKVARPKSVGRPKRGPKKKKKGAYDYEEDDFEGESEYEFGELDHLGAPLVECHKVLMQLRNHPNAWPFNEPVDPVALNIPDYFDIITHPMDLGTIQKNLEAGDYSTIGEFADDVRLVWSNAQTYNPPGHQINLMAKQLSSYFNRLFSKIQAKFGSEEASVDSLEYDSTKDHMTSISELRDSMKSVREELQRLRREKSITTPSASPAVKRRPKSQPKEDTREMTYQEKHALSLAINNLAPENLGKVVQIIHQRMPNLAQSSPEEIEIDIDSLDNGTLRALERYVKSVQKKKKKPQVPRESKIALAQITSQNTSKSIQDVKQRLQALQSKSHQSFKNKKDEETEQHVVIDDEGAIKQTYSSVVIPKDETSSSESSSGSSSTDSDSSSDSDKEKKSKKKEKKTKKVTTTAAAQEPPKQKSTDSLLETTSEIKDSALPQTLSPKAESKEEEKEEAKQEEKEEAKEEAKQEEKEEAKETQESSIAPEKESPVDTSFATTTTAPSSLEEKETLEQPQETSTQQESQKSNLEVSEPPQIIQASTAIDSNVELQNLDSWTNLGEADENTESNVVDQTWSQFQNRDLQNQQREKQREEEEHREKLEREKRELELRKEEEEKLKELKRLEEEKKKKEEEERLAAERELQERREEAKRAREETQNEASLDVSMDQSIIMKNFEQTMGSQEKPQLFDIFKLKDEDDRDEDKQLF